MNIIKMPYNTRRKSLSLPALGIQLPNASRAHRPSISKASPPMETPQQPPAKKTKRSYTSNSHSPISPSRPKSSAPSNSTKAVSFADRPKSSGRVAYENTPPPSPRASTDGKVDTEGINDDIVIGVIEQLEQTGNRPHLIKELSTVLSSISDAVSRQGILSFHQVHEPRADHHVAPRIRPPYSRHDFQHTSNAHGVPCRRAHSTKS